jgi:hypothetical protein
MVLAVALLSAFLAAAADAAPLPSAGNSTTITRNPDGTLTIQTRASEKGTNGAKRKGLMIQPQIITPFVPAPKNERGG